MGKIGPTDSPSRKLSRHDFDETLEFRKMPVVRAQATEELPNPLNGIAVGAVRGEEEENQRAFVLPEPFAGWRWIERTML